VDGFGLSASSVACRLDSAPSAIPDAWKMQLSQCLRSPDLNLVICVCVCVVDCVVCLLSTLCVCVCVCVCVFLSFQDLTMKLSLIQSVGLIAKAVCVCVRKQGYVFSRKQELITVMLVRQEPERSDDSITMFYVFLLTSCRFVSTGQDFMKAEPADSMRTPVRHLVMTACANLMYPSSSVLTATAASRCHAHALVL